MVEIKNLGFDYGKTPLFENISITLTGGHIYGLLGENGVGKTTLLTLLCGLKKPKSGTIRTDGYNPYNREPSFLQDQYFLADNIPAFNMKACDFAKINGKFRDRFDYEKFITIMKEFDTDPSFMMNKMSYGQLKKCYISFALACNVKYLYMDEPTNGLDIPSKTQFRSAISRFTNEDSTIVISTHQVRDLENIIDPVIILDNNDILLNASIEKITEKLYFDYTYSNIEKGSQLLYEENIAGSNIKVMTNKNEIESKVNLEALFNAVLRNKQFIKEIFNK